MARNENNHHVLPLFCDDLIASTVDMTPACFGAYMRILCYYLYTNPGMIKSMDDVLKYSDIIFSPDEMSMLGAIVGYWFGSRTWSRK